MAAWTLACLAAGMSEATGAAVEVSTSFSSMTASQVGSSQVLVKRELTTGQALVDARSFAATVDADLGKGWVEGEALVSSPYQPPMSQSSRAAALLRPIYRVERAPGNTANEVIPVTWRVRLRQGKWNYGDVAGGSSDEASTSIKTALQVQASGGTTYIARSEYHYTASRSGTSGEAYDGARLARTGSPGQNESVILMLPHPILEDEHILLQRVSATNAFGYASVTNLWPAEDNSSFDNVFLTVQHTARPGNGLQFFLRFELEAISRAWGAEVATKWEDFELTYQLPPGYILVSTDGLDLSKLDASRPAPPAPSIQAIADYRWDPTTERLTLHVPGLTGRILDVQQTTDLANWSTIQRIEGSTSGQLIDVDLGYGSDLGNLRPVAQFYRVIVRD